MHGVVNGLPRGYVSDLLARAAAGGELLGLAFAALMDAEQWLEDSVDPKSASRRSLAGRGLAEVSGLWSLSAGHAAVNVAARVVCIPQGALNLGKGSWTSLPTPFDQTPQANLSLNPKTVARVVAAAEQTGEIALRDFVAPLKRLVVNPAWEALVERRHVGYHRLRPQTLAGGVPARSPWRIDESTGYPTMSIKMTTDHVPPELEKIVMEAAAGYDALCSAMGDVNDRLPAAIRAAGVPLWRIT